MVTLFSSFVKNPAKTSYDGKDEDEDIVYLFRGSFVRNLKWIFIAIVMLLLPFLVSIIYGTTTGTEAEGITPQFALSLMLFWYVATFGFILHNFLLWFFNVYIVSNKKIIDIDFKGFTYKNISEAPINNVEDVTSNVNGTFGTIFNYGFVNIQTAGNQREFEFENVSNPSQVRDLIADFVSNNRNGEPE